MERLHHANLIVGAEDYRDFVFDTLIRDLNFNVKANPDFLLAENQSFGIDDARNLKKWVAGKPLTGEIKVSLIIAKSITHEAQNALLKVLEEPPAGTYIFINLESFGGLLPTFISRIMVLHPSASANSENPPIKSTGSKFLNSDIKGKLSIIRSLLKNTDKTEMKELLRDLEEISYKKYTPESTKDIAKTKAMKDILMAKIFASARGSSPKMLLEWLSCVL